MDETYVMDKEDPNQAQAEINKFEARLENKKSSLIAPAPHVHLSGRRKAASANNSPVGQAKQPKRPLSARSRGVPPPPSEEEVVVEEDKKAVKELDEFDRLHGGAESDSE
ncbi:hypothetical protein KFL_000130450 [Klebsormidium nitens]|uniref:Uncharacterized protein n=1 Tax=Klebsormidium nitens TaxID=105231 RepID=A0A1Y1HLD2_KLENI|nr:hypothetical protein KFL_000130450 [Klebsormidium nitens]|eukprot:GAQ78462.1 hypothetical protein KFL_000130450 [Klebsormidium nitens]